MNLEFNIIQFFLLILAMEFSNSSFCTVRFGEILCIEKTLKSKEAALKIKMDNKTVYFEKQFQF